MIDHIKSETNFNSISNVTNAKHGEIRLGFEELITEKTAFEQTLRHGFVGDGQVVFPELNGRSAEVINALMSLTDDLEDIWEIVLRIEKGVDTEALTENIVRDFDNAAGRNSVAALLTRFWKKKELLGDDAVEGSIDVLAYFNQSHIVNRTASELEALILKNKEQKLITAVNSDLS